MSVSSSQHEPELHMCDYTLSETSNAEAQPRHLTSEELFAGQVEVVITHSDKQYRLRITRQDKLILTK